MNGQARIRPVLLLHGVSDQRDYGRGRKSFSASLEDVTMLVQGGESLGVLGGRRDGVGLLSEVISGIRQPAAGRMFVDGEPVVLDEAGAFLPQETLRFNMVRFAMAHQMSGQRMRSAVGIVAVEAGLDESALDQETGAFEHDVVERIRFYLALATGTRILVVEEAESLFDILQQEQELKKLDAFRGRGGSLIVISQEIRHQSGITDRTCWLHEGRIIMDAETATVSRWRKQLKSAQRDGDQARAAQLLRRFERQYEAPVLSLRGRGGGRVS